MANFKTHITTSTCCGLAYGAYGYLLGGFSASTSIIAAGLGSVAGMLPDLDSDNGVPVRETFCFASAVIPIMMLDRFKMMGLSHEDIVIAAAGIYLFVRFGISRIFKRYTVHRGMWHSVPACATCGLLAYIICSCDERDRIFKALAVVVGFMSHLILDEIYSVDLRNRRIKKSFGTAVKFFGPKLWANVSTYGKLALVLAAVTIGEHEFVEYFKEPAHRFHYRAGRVVDRAHDALDQVLKHRPDLRSPRSGDAEIAPPPDSPSLVPPPSAPSAPRAATAPTLSSPQAGQRYAPFPPFPQQPEGSSGFGGPLFQR